jgi:hypothetical protein
VTQSQIEKWQRDDKYLNKQNDCYVYFILHGYEGYLESIVRRKWDEKSYVKVGISKDPKKRLSTIQLSNPIELIILGYIPGNETIEKKIHHHLKEHHSRGEWFKYNYQVHEFIDGLYLLDYKGEKQHSYYDEKYPSLCHHAHNKSVRLHDPFYYEAEDDIPDMMRLLFGDSMEQTYEARKTHIDEFNDIIDVGESYWKIGGFGDVRKFSQRTIKKVMRHFKMHRICANALDALRTKQAEGRERYLKKMDEIFSRSKKNNEELVDA